MIFELSSGFDISVLRNVFKDLFRVSSRLDIRVISFKIEKRRIPNVRFFIKLNKSMVMGSAILMLLSSNSKEINNKRCKFFPDELEESISLGRAFGVCEEDIFGLKSE